MFHKLFVDKYQPVFFNDFEMYEDIIEILKTLIQVDNLNILFVGDGGSGKTSILNTLVREYYKDQSYQTYKDNVLYINNLKEQGINYYRTDCKTFCQTKSSIKNKKKIIILDDLDFINEQSQEVFRNCIDKYSHNVHFISSCTNIQKVIESIQSRFLIIKMKPLTRESLNKIMNKIKKLENIDVEPQAQDFVLNVSNSSAKILMNYMEKFKLINDVIDVELAKQVCTNISFSVFEDYTKNVKEKNLLQSINILYDLHDKGYSVMDILDSYFLFVKTTNLLSEDEKYMIIPYICKYISVFHNIHEDEIELALFTNNLIQCGDTPSLALT
jgi:DNA polymerase III delta prime subunit